MGNERNAFGSRQKAIIIDLTSEDVDKEIDSLLSESQGSNDTRIKRDRCDTIKMGIIDVKKITDPDKH